MESNLTKNVSQFMAVGKIKITSKTFKIDQKVSAKWKMSFMNLYMDCGEKKFRTQIRGGYNPLEDKVMYAPYGGLLWEVKDGKVDYQNKKFSVKRTESNKQEILDRIAPSCKLKVKISEEKEFISVYDMINYLESLDAEVFKEKLFRVYGNISYSFSKSGDLMENYDVSIITEVSPETEPTIQYRQSVLISPESVKTDNSDSIHVKGFVPEYISSKGDIEVRSIVALPFDFIISKEKTPNYQIYLDKFFTVDKNRMSEVTITYDVDKSGDVRELTFEDIDTAENQEYIELYRLLGKSDEEILSEFTKASKRIVASPTEKHIKYFVGIYTKPVYGEDKMKMIFDYTPNKYKESEVYFIGDFSTKTVKSKNKKQEEETEEDMDELKNLLGL